MTLAGTQMGSGVFDSVTKDGVTTFGTGVDPTVGSLGYTYTDAGLLASATSYGTVVGAGPAPVLNQDAETYDGFGQLATEEQAVAGTASPASPTVGYTYDAANGDRMTGIVYPDGRTLAYSYAGSSLSTAASQLTSIGDASGTIQSYSYLGLDTPVTFADGNGTELTYLSTTGSTGDAGDKVTGLDRFGRVADQNWVNSSGTSVDEQKYTYDADSNALSDDNTVLPAQSELYTYDGLNRLATFDRGTLNGTATAVAGTAGTTESWSLDALGNWQSDTVNGTTTTRTNSAQNQVGTVTTPRAGGGNTTATLGYDKDGNTLKDATGQQYVYDAWNRLAAVKNAAGAAVAAYAYDAQGRRVTEGEAGVTTATYYSDQWQDLEDRQSGITTSQYVWSPFDVDQLVERDDEPVGGVDPTFGVDHSGVIDYPLNPDTGMRQDIVVGYAGSVGETAGDGSSGDGEDILVGSGHTVAMLTADGNVDPAFGTSGPGTVSLLDPSDDIFSVVPEADGEILVGYLSQGGSGHLMELTSTGTWDSSFGTDGVADLPSSPYGWAVGVRPDGAILVAGLNAAGDVTLSLLTAGGQVDASFGTGGTTTTTCVAGSLFDLEVVAESDGTAVVAAIASDYSTTDLLRFDAGGTWDTSFGTDGVATTGIVAVYPSYDGEVGGQAAAVDLLADGDILVAGADTDTGDTVGVARLTAGGELDPTFGTGGVCSADSSEYGTITTVVGVTVAADGRILVGYGSSAASGGESGPFCLSAFTADGEVDKSFGAGLGDDGTLTGAEVDATLGMVVQPTGKVVMVGATAHGQPGTGQASLTLERFDPTAMAERLYAEQDANDNVTSLTNSAGAVVERYAYDPYGAVTVENPDGTTRGTGAASASYYGSVYLYQGMRLDVVTGTYDGKRRVYDVDLERWLQPDPAGYVDGPDTYQDELSSPADGTDPTGLAFVPSSGAASDELNPFTGGGPSADPGETAAVLGDPAVNGFGTSGGGPTPGAVTSAAQTAPAGPITLLGTTTSRYLPLSGAADPCPFGLGPEQDASTEEASGPNDPQVLLYEAQAYDASHPYAVPDERSTLYQVTTYLALATGQGSAQGLLDNPGVQDALAWSQDAVTGANQFGLAAVDAVDTFGFLIDPELLGIEGIEGIEVNTLGCFRAGTAVRSGTGERHPIERVGIGRRVATPEQSADRPGRRVDPAAQRVVRLHVVKDGQQLRLAFLRPAALVGHLSAGDTVHLDIFELQVKGPARVVGVDPCPPLEEGAGRLVTGTAVSDSVDVLRLKLAGLADPLEVTGNHPVFSEDHQDFVSAKVLRPGRRLRTADGAGTTVEAVERLVGRFDVHNLEVDGAHQYFVTGLDVLVHNAGGNGIQANKAAGDLWEQDIVNNQLPATQTDIETQVTIRSSGPSGLNVRVDAIGTENSSGGVIRLTDGKASQTAPFTPNQTIVYPELGQYGGVVAGQGKGIYPGGTVIPPTQVDVIRKP